MSCPAVPCRSGCWLSTTRYQRCSGRGAGNATRIGSPPACSTTTARLPASYRHRDQRAVVRRLPIRDRLRAPVRCQPGHVGNATRVHRPASEGTGAGQRLAGAACRHETRGETGQRLIRGRPSRARRSRCPAHRRCCCRAGCGRTRRPWTASACRATSSSVASSARWSPSAGRADRGVVGRALDAVVPRMVVVGAVAVVLAVGLVVLARRRRRGRPG